MLRKILKTLLYLVIIIIMGTVIYLMTQIDITNPDDLNVFLERKFQKAHISGMAVTLIRDNEITYFNGLGYSDIDKKKGITEDTIFQIASTSKTITGTAVMQLYEKGLLDIDEDINTYLPMEIRNPYYPDTPITTRMLLTHTSTILDNWDLIDPLYTNETGEGGDSPIELGTFNREYLMPGGKWYDEDKNYYNGIPGSYYEYSNSGFGLLGYIVEAISGQGFNEYCNENIFKPLGMDNTGWFLSEINLEQMAVLYSKENGLTPIPFYGFPTYPDGCLKTSSKDYAGFLMAYMNGGEYNGRRILKESTINEMLKPQIPELAEKQGLAWDRHAPEEFKINCKGMIVPGHTGGDPGISTIAFYYPDKKTGAILFINTGLEFEPRLVNILMVINRLFHECLN